ncbi:carcinine hydrolase/isopenicillin-N N-acyltransferase family protein [Maribacter algarum]|uniref:carcinine hydrolase/isopenicillin-N N-acyltransferase family protein n=1 Tax=Maribacter algarum (ex Zhang et al. 2020) TaxID=2578118 RepID=UPI0014875701|nr:carcinine hydrolase/isopenicillin-N N-acyltransferase family protein [Maribacter algarum]
MQRKTFALFFFLFISIYTAKACAVLYYVDSASGKIYVANNEDYWYDTKAYIQIEPKSKQGLARLWYGWKDFAQGGVNEAGLFFDGAVTPEQKIPKTFKKIKGNLGDDILANCTTVDEAIAYLEKRKIGLKNAHMMFGDATGNAAVIEWVDGQQKIIKIANNRLIMTNFLLADSNKAGHSCPRYDAIQKEIERFEKEETSIDLLTIGNTMARAVQVPQQNKDGKTGGTLYTSFINITDMEFVLVYKLDNTKITKLVLKSEFQKSKKRKIELL